MSANVWAADMCMNDTIWTMSNTLCHGMYPELCEHCFALLSSSAARTTLFHKAQD